MITHGSTATSTFHEYINEAILSIRNGLEYQRMVEPEIRNGEFTTNHHSISDINYRYAFIMIANSLEAAANAMMLTLGAVKEDYQNLEKLNVVLKFKIFCDIKRVKFNGDNLIVKKIREISSCRNNFVHPKPNLTPFTIDKQTNAVIFETKKTALKKYPNYFTEISLEHTLEALKDCLNFISWVVFDLCQYSLVDGALLIGYFSYGSTGYLREIEVQCKVEFDHRCFAQ